VIDHVEPMMPVWHVDDLEVGFCICCGCHEDGYRLGVVGLLLAGPGQ
jgi:hypothetical protein